jgi:hypothetical protein
VYNLCTIFVQFVYNFCTICVQFVYNLCTICVQFVYNLCTICVQFRSVHVCGTDGDGDGDAIHTNGRREGRTNFTYYQIAVTCSCARVLWAHVRIVQRRNYTLFCPYFKAAVSGTLNDIKVGHVFGVTLRPCLHVWSDLTVT